MIFFHPPHHIRVRISTTETLRYFEHPISETDKQWMNASVLDASIAFGTLKLTLDLRYELWNWMSTEPIQQEEPTGRCGME